MKSSKENSKFLSLVLRHQPEVIGITLSQDGWADIDELIEKSRRKNVVLTHDSIMEIVTTSDKQRFKVSEDGGRIRANQGHSVSVDVGLSEQVPPETLFHGTADRFIVSIREEGLRPGSRQHVHLSVDQATAMKVGARHGKPIVLIIRSGVMHRDGSRFFRSENGVWLVQHVPVKYLDIP